MIQAQPVSPSRPKTADRTVRLRVQRAQEVGFGAVYPQTRLTRALTRGRVTLSVPAPSRVHPTEQDDRQARAPPWRRSDPVDNGAGAMGRTESVTEED